jgi:hypothetical protein
MTILSGIYHDSVLALGFSIWLKQTSAFDQSILYAYMEIYH